MNNEKLLTPKEISRELNISYEMALKILREKVINAQKEKRRWKIEDSDFQIFKKENEQKLETIRKEYIDLYCQGLSIESLRDRTKKRV